MVTTSASASVQSKVANVPKASSPPEEGRSVGHDAGEAHLALAVGVVLAGRTRLPARATRTLATAVVTATIVLCAVVAVLT